MAARESARRAFPTLLALLVLLAPPALADPAQDELAPTGIVRVAVGISAAGGAFWSDRDAAGNLTGVPIELGKALAHRLALPVAFVAYDNSGLITDAAARGEWDVTFLPMDAERARKLDFGPLYNMVEATFITRAGLGVERTDQLDRPEMKIAAVSDTTTLRGAAQALKNTKVVGYRTFDEIVELLKVGRIDAFALGRSQLEALARQIPGTRVLPDSFQQTKYAVAVPPGHAAALAYVTQFMADAKADGVMRRALDANGLKDAPLF